MGRWWPSRTSNPVGRRKRLRWVRFPHASASHFPLEARGIEARSPPRVATPQGGSPLTSDRTAPRLRPASVSHAHLPVFSHVEPTRGSSAQNARGLRRFRTYGLRSGDPPASCAPLSRRCVNCPLCALFHKYGNVDVGRSGGFHEAAYGARQRLRRAESQRAVEGRERSGVEAPREPGV